MSKRSKSQLQKDVPVLVDELPQKIFDVYFSELVDEHARPFANTGAGEKFKKETIKEFKEQFMDSLRTKLQEYLNSESEAFEYDRQAMKLALQQVQKNTPQKWYFGKKLNEKELWQEISGFWEILDKYSGAYNEILEIIARAIQETVITSPYWLKTSGNNGGFIPIEKALVNAIHRLFRVRLKYLAEEKAQGLFYENLFSLYRNIFKPDAIWMPFETPATAPLKGEALKNIYAREQGAPYRLAQQIVKSDGIILISGYRGVGKSTFLNATLNEFVPIAEANQYVGTHAKIMPVYINIAKASNIGSALRLCIRGLYQAINETNEAKDKLIRDEELELIHTANIRSTFQVDISQGETFLRAKELKVAFGFNPMKISSKLSFANNLGFIPALQHNYSKSLREKIDRSIRLLDYDEDRAEEDIIELIKELAIPRLFNKKQTVVKPVFIFDELDKIPREEQDKLIRQLKNLFLSQNAVFILVTSKDFYYLLEEARRKEDSILGSYFSSVITVPIFSSRETEQLLRALMVEKVNFADKKNEPVAKFISLLAKYLTYSAFGLPREIIRELRENLLWTRAGLQPYLTNQSYPIPEKAVRVYADIQQAIENIDTQKIASSSSTEGTPSDQNFLGERLWQQDEARNEQMRRGLYVLVEELIDQGTLVNRPDENGIVTRVFQNNFKNTSRQNFNLLFKLLGVSLSQITVKETEDLACFEFSSSGEAKITVMRAFDNLIGKQPRHSLDESSKLTPEDSLEEAKKWLKTAATDNFALRRVFAYLNIAFPEISLPRDFQVEFFKLFVMPLDAPDKLSMLGYITPDTLCWILEHSTEDTYLAWLDLPQETQVLNAFLKKMLAEETVLDCPSESTLNLLFKMLEHPSKTPALTMSIVDGLIKILKNTIVKPEYIELIFDNLDKSVDLSDVSRNDLLLLAKSADIDLIHLLVEKDFDGVSMDTLSWLLEQTKYDMEQLWTTLDRTKPLSQRLLATIIWEYRDKSKKLPAYIQEWLRAKDWTEYDMMILGELGDKGLRLLFEIQEKHNFDRRRKNLLNSFIATAKKDATSSSVGGAKATKEKQTAAATKPSTSSKKKSYPSVYFLAFLLVAIAYVNLPFDISSDATLWTKAVQRAFQVVYMWLPFAILLTGSLFIDDKGLGLFILTIALISIEVWLVWYSVTSLGTPFSLSGQLWLFGSQILGIGIIWGSEPLYKRLFARNK